MSKKITASLPEGMDLDASWTIQWAALDPVTGAAVSGVTVSNVGMLVTQVTPGTADDLATEDFLPLLTPTDINEQGDVPAGTV